MRHRRVAAAILTATLVVAGQSCVPDTEQPSPEDSRQSLEVGADAVVLNGRLDVRDESISAEDVSIALRWNIEDGPYPPVSTTTSVERASGGDLFSMSSDVRPPEVAFEPSESNQRQGLAIAYVIAYLDTNENGALDCRSPGLCSDVFVGAAPNTLVMYGDKQADLSDFSVIFDFDGRQGIVPDSGWSLVHLEPNACEARPTARDWRDDDVVEVAVIGDFVSKERCEVRAVQPDVD